MLWTLHESGNALKDSWHRVANNNPACVRT